MNLFIEGVIKKKQLKIGGIHILQRKIVSATISGTLFTVLLSLIEPNPFGKPINSTGEYLFAVVSIFTLYMMYTFPAILLYGVFTSIISDKVGEFISIKIKRKKAEFVVSAMLHVLFGLILRWFSLGASILFFSTDQIMKKRVRRYTWVEAISSLIISILMWMIASGALWLWET
ncbi:hypothetical protein ACH0BF_12745 [Pseudobacillus sp. 179-B 2D1 NHS]|uniref:hypothetical protein n=1 Tax=Pseudobacillus sp. 179-B 2D1 NHS TaxID=3374292 RepID=UPI00387A626C